MAWRRASRKAKDAGFDAETTTIAVGRPEACVPCRARSQADQPGPEVGAEAEAGVAVEAAGASSSADTRPGPDAAPPRASRPSATALFHRRHTHDMGKSLRPGTGVSWGRELGERTS